MLLSLGTPGTFCFCLNCNFTVKLQGPIYLFEFSFHFIRHAADIFTFTTNVYRPPWLLIIGIGPKKPYRSISNIYTTQIKLLFERLYLP